MAAPLCMGTEGQASSRKAADWTVLDSELFAGSLGLISVEIHRGEPAPPKGFGILF